jgi:hypothetical protein
MILNLDVQQVAEKVDEKVSFKENEEKGTFTVSKGNYSFTGETSIFQNPIGITQSGNVRFKKGSLNFVVQGTKIRISYDIYTVKGK